MITDLTLPSLVAMANENDAVMDGTIEPVRQIIDDNDVVIAIWQDDLELPHGIGKSVIKGTAILRNVSANNTQNRESV